MYKYIYIYVHILLYESRILGFYFNRGEESGNCCKCCFSSRGLGFRVESVNIRVAQGPLRVDIGSLWSFTILPHKKKQVH